MKTKLSAASSQPGKLTRRSESDIQKYAESEAAKATSARLRAHGPDPSSDDLEEIPPLTDEELKKLYRPIKQPVTVRLDADIVSWLKSGGGRYQSRINAILRREMISHRNSGA